MPRRSGYSRAVARVKREVFQHTAGFGRATNGLAFNVINLTTSNLGDRVATMSEVFEFFRIVELEVQSVFDTLVPLYAANSLALGGGALHAISFVNTPSGSRTAATSFEQMAQDQRFEIGNPTHRLRFKVGRADLLAEPMVWFNTFTTGSVPASTLSAGCITSSMSLAVNQTITGVTQLVSLRGVIEFHSEIDPADSFRLHIPRSIQQHPAVASTIDRLKKVVEFEEETV